MTFIPDTGDKILLLGKNYQLHAEELKEKAPDDFPAVFIKPFSALLYVEGNDNKIKLDHSDGSIHHELELVYHIKENFQEKEPHEISHYLSGVTLGLDLTKRDLQKNLKTEGLPWTLSKYFPSSAVIMNKLYDLGDDFEKKRSFILKVNNTIRQQGKGKEMIFDALWALSKLSYKMPICRGDFFFTGTPSGVGPLNSGDELTFYFEGKEEDAVKVSFT